MLSEAEVYWLEVSQHRERYLSLYRYLICTLTGFASLPSTVT